MKRLIAILAIAVSSAAFADVGPSMDSMDFGIVSGALNSKVHRVTAGNYDYAVIGVDLIEPACNSVQAVIWVSDENVEGDAGGVAYNLGLQLSGIKSVKVVGNTVVMETTRNNVQDCSQKIKETYEIEYTGNGGQLKVKQLT